MRYKHIAKVGTIMITTFVFLAVLMYYFNQDECPVSTFPCKNSTECKPQRSWCDGRRDCPEGDDESIDCFDLNGNWDYYRKLWLQNSRVNVTPTICPNVTKYDPGYYENCEYKTCTVICEKFTKRGIPQDFTENLMTLTFINGSLPVLKKKYFQRYTNLRKLILKNNGILILEHNVLIKQKFLNYLSLSDNKLQEITRGHLTGLMSLDTLTVDNNKIHTLDLADLENSTKLNLLDLDQNLLTTSNLSLPFLPALKELNLDKNHLESITEDIFSELPALTSLTLEFNLIEYISPNAFKNLNQLKDLNLMHNKIVSVPTELFKPVGNLSVLYIGFNQITKLSSTTFEPLKNSLKSLDVEEIDMDGVDKNLFNMFTKLDTVYFAKFHYCTTYAPNVKICHPASDGVSSLSNLLSKPLLKIAVWGISCVTCLGNALVLWGRFTARDENRVLSIIIRNLAVSDLLMGVYLLIIGLQDIRFRNNYSQEASAWMSSWPCTLIGMLAMTSSEVSVLILSFMSVERFMLIAAPFKGHRAVTPQTAASSMIVVWVTGLTLALFPAIHWRSSTRFYGLNGMCFPLHIDDPFLVGWEYSAFIFLGINLIGLITIGYVYAGMFVSIWKTRHATPLSVGDSEFALRFFLIVLTDAVCWAPIIVLKIMALAEYPVAPDVHAWVVIFILPVNSAVNPLLYTFTTPKFRERLNEGWFGKMRSIVSRKQSRSGSQTSYEYTNKNVMPFMSISTKAPNDEKTSRQSLNETLLIDIMLKEK